MSENIMYKNIADKIKEQEKELIRLKDLKEHYLKYREDNEEQKEVYDILELGKHRNNLHKKVKTGGLLWIDLPMTKFSALSSYIRSKDLFIEELKQEKEDYKSRCEKAIEYIEDVMELTKECPQDLLNILNGRSDE